MLYLNTGTSPRRLLQPDAGSETGPDMDGTIWLDLLKPNDREREAAEHSRAERDLALAGVRERVASVGGAVELADTVGQRFVFRLRLPLQTPASRRSAP